MSARRLTSCRIDPRRLLALLLCALLPHLARAAVINVPSGEPTIQGAINAAGTWDEIWVAPGIYTENLNFLGKSVIVRSSDPTDPDIVDTTIIDGSDAGPVVTFNTGETTLATLDGFTIRNGTAPQGGGIYCNGASPTIRHNVITDNRANYGGGLYVTNNSSPIIRDNVINLNLALTGNGGGIVCNVGSTPTILSNTINNNGAYAYGGGIMCYDHASASLMGNTINGNVAGAGGGGIMCQQQSHATINNNDVTNNQAQVWGGGIACYQSCNPSIVGNTISGNSATMDSDYTAGGGIYAQSLCALTVTANQITENSSAEFGGGIGISQNSSILLENNWLIANTADFGGGLCAADNAGGTISNNLFWNNDAVWGGGILLAQNAMATIDHNILHHNTASSLGGGVACIVTGEVQLTNNTLVANQADKGGGIAAGPATTIRNCIVAFSPGGGGICAYPPLDEPSVYFTDCFGNLAENYLQFLASPTGTNGNISADPLFADVVGHDYHLKSTGGRWDPTWTRWVIDRVHSPCIDRGNPADAFADEPAPNGDRINMGAYGGTIEASKSRLPAVTASKPVSGATGVSPTARILIHFSEPMWKATVEGATTLEAFSGGVWTDVPFTFRWFGTEVVYLDPVERMAYNTPHRVTIARSARTPDERRMGEVFTLPFTTSDSFVRVVSPGDGATGVFRQRSVELYLRWRVRQDSLESRFWMSDATGLGVRGTLNWVEPQRHVEFIPEQPLAADMLYTVRVAWGTRLADDSFVLWPETFTFKTADHPAVVGSLPRGDAVPTDANIRMVFDRAMLTGSVETNFSVDPALTGVFTWTSGRRVMVLDPDAPLAADTDYQVTVNAAARSADDQRLEMPSTWTFHTAPAAPASVLVTAAAATTRSGATQVTVNLSAAATVEVNVCNVAGRVVAALPPRALPRGMSTLLWDGRSTAGTNVPAGRYLLRVQARGADGATAQCLAAVQR